MDVMSTRFGLQEAGMLYAKPCPIVGASIGQHVRHSMDHLEMAARLAAAAVITGNSDVGLHYDLRQRGGPDEDDMAAAELRINNTIQLLESMERSKELCLPDRLVNAYFMLSADPTEFRLPTTIEREMGFCAHHSIHHLAMVRVIALETIGLAADDLGNDFGRAPSTLVFDNDSSSS